MRKFLLGVAGAAALGMASAAPATVTVDGPNTSVITGVDQSTGGIEFTIAYLDVGLANPFDETLAWSNDLAGLYAVTLTTASVNITDLFLTGTGIVGQIDIPPTDLTFEQFGLAGINLGAGDYTLHIKGTYSGDVSGFTGDVAFNAIPEPAVWAMMIIGFAGIGTAMRRRNVKPAVHFA